MTVDGRFSLSHFLSFLPFLFPTILSVPLAFKHINLFMVEQVVPRLLLFFFSHNRFLKMFDDDDIVEKDACPYGPPVRMGRVRGWGKVDDTTAFSPAVYLSCISVGGVEGV